MRRRTTTSLGALAIALAALLGCRGGETKAAGERAVAGPEAEQAAAPTVLIEADTPEALDALADYTFAIMSDNRGDGPQDSVHMERTVQWVKDMGARFVIGLGDHVKRDWANGFLPFLQGDAFWSAHFWPNIADGENEFYGRDQADWAAGRGLLEHCGIAGREGVELRDNGAEYYAKIPVPSGTVHLIQLHYPDQPIAPDRAFREESREWMVATLEGIERGEGDIVIVGAHSFMGDWLPVLSDEHREVVLETADLVLSATTHVFRRLDYGDDAALCINTGAVGYSAETHGFVTVHLLGDPWRLLVQYVDTMAEKRELAPEGQAFIKELGGPITAAFE